jgi:transporter family protein
VSVVGLALIGMLCWGIGPIFAKLGLGTMDPVTGLGIRTLAAGAMVTGWLAAAPRTPRFYAVSLRGLLLIVLEAALATVFGDLAYYAALKKGQCAETSLILSASPAVTVLLSAIVLGERPSSWSLAGAAFIAIGLALVGLQPRS